MAPCDKPFGRVCMPKLSMSNTSVLESLRDMRGSCNRILTYTASLDRELFFDTSMVYDATMWNLLIIGEAANRLPDHITEASPDIPWRQLVGFRNRLAHEYEALDKDTIWLVVSLGVAELGEQLRVLINRLTQERAPDG